MISLTPLGAIPFSSWMCSSMPIMLDYGLKRADYIEAFFKNINGSVVDARVK